MSRRDDFDNPKPQKNPDAASPFSTAGVIGFNTAPPMGPGVGNNSVPMMPAAGYPQHPAAYPQHPMMPAAAYPQYPMMSAAGYPQQPFCANAAYPPHITAQPPKELSLRELVEHHNAMQEKNAADYRLMSHEQISNMKGANPAQPSPLMTQALVPAPQQIFPSNAQLQSVGFTSPNTALHSVQSQPDPEPALHTATKAPAYDPLESQRLMHQTYQKLLHTQMKHNQENNARMLDMVHTHSMRTDAAINNISTKLDLVSLKDQRLSDTLQTSCHNTGIYHEGTNEAIKLFMRDPALHDERVKHAYDEAVGLAVVQFIEKVYEDFNARNGTRRGYTALWNNLKSLNYDAVEASFNLYNDRRSRYLNRTSRKEVIEHGKQNGYIVRKNGKDVYVETTVENEKSQYRTNVLFLAQMYDDILNYEKYVLDNDHEKKEMIMQLKEKLIQEMSDTKLHIHNPETLTELNKLLDDERKLGAKFRRLYHDNVTTEQKTSFNAKLQDFALRVQRLQDGMNPEERNDLYSVFTGILSQLAKARTYVKDPIYIQEELTSLRKEVRQLKQKRPNSSRKQKGKGKGKGNENKLHGDDHTYHTRSKGSHGLVDGLGNEHAYIRDTRFRTRGGHGNDSDGDGDGERMRD